MKVNISQSVGARFTNAVNSLKRISSKGIAYISDVFERSPKTDVFVRSNCFEKPNIPETDKKYIDLINKIPVSGAGEDEKPILNLVHESMFKMLKLTDGTSAPYNEIMFVHMRDPHSIAAVYGSANTLVVNKTYLENIDYIIDETVHGFEVLQWVEKDKNGQYKIPEYLRNDKCKQLEKLLNEYSSDWSVKEKFLFDTMLVKYYMDFASQACHFPSITIKKIMENANNRQILQEHGLLKTQEEIMNMRNWEKADYVKQIGKYCVPQEDFCLLREPESIFDHEYIHKLCFDNFSKEYLEELHNKTTIQKWKDDEHIQLTANKISLRAADNPMEYIAEVGSGLAIGQKFDKDAMSLYESLKGPKL